MNDAFTKTYIGVDISKKTFDVALYISEELHQLQFRNNRIGFRQLHKWLKEHKIGEAHVCMEATGRYGDALARFLHEQGYEVSVVNPKRIKAYAESQLVRNKTDAMDAVIIEDFCRTQKQRLWEPPSEEIEELQMMTRHLEALKKMRVQESNRLQSGLTSKIVCRTIKKHIAYLDREIKQLEEQIDDHTDNHPNLKEATTLLESIPGIGRQTAVKLVAEIKDIRNFENASELASYAGMSPQHRESGSSVRRRSRLSKIGNASLRKALYFPTIVARQHNPIVRSFSERLAENGKQKMVIQGASMRKLLHIVYGVWKHGRPFDPAYELRFSITA